MSQRAPADHRNRHRDTLRRRARYLDGVAEGRQSRRELTSLEWALAVLKVVTDRGLMPELDPEVHAAVVANQQGDEPLW